MSLPALEIFATRIRPPHRVLPPLHFRKPFFELELQHTRPVKWTLYRSLLREAPNETHRQAIRQRWRRPRTRYSTSPAATTARLVEEERWLEDYRRVNTVVCTGTAASADLEDAERTQGSLALAESRTRITQLEDRVERLAEQRRLEEAIKLEHLRAQLSSAQLDLDFSSYMSILCLFTSKDQALAAREFRFRPIVTPGFLYPSLSNPPLPRIKPQPLHITMPIVKRRKAYDRRMPKQRAWQEMLLHVKHEAAFERDLGIHTVPISTEEIQDVLRSYAESFDRDFKRAKSKFAPEILAKANLARSRRPTHLTRAARKRRSSQVMHGVLSRLARESEA